VSHCKKTMRRFVSRLRALLGILLLVVCLESILANVLVVTDGGDIGIPGDLRSTLALAGTGDQITFAVATVTLDTALSVTLSNIEIKGPVDIRCNSDPCLRIAGNLRKIEYWELYYRFCGKN